MTPSKPPRTPRVTLPYLPPATSIAESIERHLHEQEVRVRPRLAATLPMGRPVRPRQS